MAYDESLNDFTARGSSRILCAWRWRFFLCLGGSLFVASVDYKVPLRPGLNIPLYRFSAAISIPIFCLYIHRDDVLLGVWGRGRGLVEFLDTIFCCYLANWVCVKPGFT